MGNSCKLLSKYNKRRYYDVHSTNGSSEYPGVMFSRVREPEPVASSFPTPELRGPAQRKAWESFQRHAVTLLTGPPGTGKTYLAVAYAVKEVLEGRSETIFLTRPNVEAGEHLGFQPGTVDQKIGVFMGPFFDALTQLVGPPKSPRRMLIDKAIELRPLAFLRGATLRNGIALLDEAQNCSRAQIKMYLSRIGEGTTMIISGHPEQNDLTGIYGVCDFETATSRIQAGILDGDSGLSGRVGVVDFTGSKCERHPIIEPLMRIL